MISKLGMGASQVNMAVGGRSPGLVDATVNIFISISWEEYVNLMTQEFVRLC
jgi:hypothetical protein